MNKKVVLITGASNGIGYELVLLFAKAKRNLVLVARSEEKLNEMKSSLENEFGISVKFIVKDLSKNDSAKEIFDELERENVFVDILVNNAGYGLYGFFEKTDLQDELDMIQLNVASLTYLTKLFLKRMIEKKEGKILNVASLVSFQPVPLMAVYAATKAFVLSFSEALSNELKGTGVTVTALCPGGTRTGFEKRAGADKTDLFKKGIMAADVVAKMGYDALMKGKPVVISGFFNFLSSQGSRFLPRKAMTSIVRLMMERISKNK